MKNKFQPIVFILCLLLLSCGSSKLEQKEVIRPVRYQQVYSTGGVRERSFSGVAKAALESNLSFKVAGTVEQVRVKVGDTVSAGSLIARLAPQDYELQVQETEASLTSARAEARNAKSQYERVRGLIWIRRVPPQSHPRRASSRLKNVWKWPNSN